MQTINLTEIQIPPNRQRTLSDARKLEELKQSIIREGLFHAIVLTGENELVAGATRLRAIREIYQAGTVIFYNSKEVPLGFVPFTFTHKTDEASLFRIELEENLRREQLSPIDEAQALARLHELQQTLAPEIIPGSGLKTPVTFKDTAKILGEITGQPQTNDAQRISDSILVDKFKDLPEVKNAKSLGEAARLARKAAERLFRETLGTMEVVASPSRHRVLHGDCSSLLANVEAGTVDVIIADPPYGVGADEFGEQSKIGHAYKDDIGAFFDVMRAIAENASRICKPDAAMFIFMDIGMFHSIDEDWYMASTPEEQGEWYNDNPHQGWLKGWYIWPTPLIWHKPNRGHAPQPKRGPSRRYEAILYAVRGNREVRKVGSDVLTFPVPDDRAHAAGKPPALYQELLSWIVYPGDTVLDPCAGSGTVIPACAVLDCNAIAIEKDAGFVTMIREQVEKENSK